MGVNAEVGETNRITAVTEGRLWAYSMQSFVRLTVYPWRVRCAINQTLFLYNQEKELEMKTVSRAVKASCMLAAVWCLSGFTGPAAQAQVLNQVPSDALVVLKINKLADTNTKISNFLQTLGVTDLQPTLKDPIGSLETQLGLGAGLDTKRDAAGVILNGTFEKDSPPFVLLLPVSDYKAFLGTVTVVRTEGDVTVAHFKDNEDDAFIESWGDYAAISDKKDNVLVKHAGLKVTGSAEKQLEEKDVCVYVNFPALKPLLLPKLKEGADDAMKELEKNQTDPAKQKLAKAAADQLVAAITEFLNDAQDATIGVSITPEGIGSNMMVDLAPDTYLGKLATAFKSTDKPLLAGLPKENYLAFGGSIQNPAAVTKVIDDLIAPVLKELEGQGEDGKKAISVIDAYRDALGAVDSTSFGLVAPTAALGQGPLIRFLYVTKGDAEKFKTATAKAADGENQLMALAGAPGGDLLKTTVTPNFKTVNGVKFDRIQTEVDPNNTSQEAMQMSDMFSKMYGPDGNRVLSGVVDPKTIIMASGIDDDLLGQSIDAAKEGKDDLTEDLKVVDAGLPKNRAGVFYFGLGQLLSTGISYAKANGILPFPIQLPNNLPPIGFAFGTDGPTMHYDSFVPMKLMQSIVQTAAPIFQQFGGGNHGGGGGL
jgi:hypothetical protein